MVTWGCGLFLSGLGFLGFWALSLGFWAWGFKALGSEAEPWRAVGF